MTKKFKEIRNSKLKEEAPVNSAGVNVSTDVPLVKTKTIVLRRKQINMKAE
jgi:hypothetical protein